jgi:hypothetical protein
VPGGIITIVGITGIITGVTIVITRDTMVVLAIPLGMVHFRGMSSSI